MLTDDEMREIAQRHIAHFGTSLSLSNPVMISEPPGLFYKAVRPASDKSTGLVSPFFVRRDNGSLVPIKPGDVMPGTITKLYGWETMRKDADLQMAVLDPDFSKPRHVEVWSAIIREIMNSGKTIPAK